MWASFPPEFTEKSIIEVRTNIASAMYLIFILPNKKSCTV